MGCNEGSTTFVAFVVLEILKIKVLMTSQSGRIRTRKTPSTCQISVKFCQHVCIVSMNRKNVKNVNYSGPFAQKKIPCTQQIFLHCIFNTAMPSFYLTSFISFLFLFCFDLTFFYLTSFLFFLRFPYGSV